MVCEPREGREEVEAGEEEDEEKKKKKKKRKKRENQSVLGWGGAAHIKAGKGTSRD